MPANKMLSMSVPSDMDNRPLKAPFITVCFQSLKSGTIYYYKVHCKYLFILSVTCDFRSKNESCSIATFGDSTWYVGLIPDIVRSRYFHKINWLATYC